MEEQFKITWKQYLKLVEPWFSKRVTPIFYQDDNKLEHVATGTFYTFQGEIILVTCAHVFESRDVRKFFIYSPKVNSWIALEGYLQLSYDHLSKAQNNLDFAYLVLNSNVINLIGESFEFITYPKIETGHKIDESKYYFLIGFPCRKVSLSKQHPMDVSATLEFVFNRAIPESKYSNLGYNSKFHILIHHNKRKLVDVEKRRAFSGNLQGMSGGIVGVIDNNVLIDSNNPEVKILGILSEYTSKLFAGTRIDFVLNSLKSNNYHRNKVD